MLPSANISNAAATIRLGELENRGLTAPARTAVSQIARNTSIDSVPSIQLSLRRQYDRRGGARVGRFSVSIFGEAASTMLPPSACPGEVDAGSPKRTCANA